MPFRSVAAERYLKRSQQSGGYYCCAVDYTDDESEGALFYECEFDGATVTKQRLYAEPTVASKVLGIVRDHGSKTGNRMRPLDTMSIFDVGPTWGEQRLLDRYVKVATTEIYALG